MPRTTKDATKKSTTTAKKATKPNTAKKEKEEKIKETTTKKPKESKKTVTKKTATAKKETAKKVSTSKTEATKTTTKKTSATKKASNKATTRKTTTSNKNITTTKKTTTVKKSKVSKSRKTIAISSLEYYDLPYRYNQTTVKILAQTPKTLFVYWDISDDDRNLLNLKFGDDFFNKTRPVLIVHNETLEYSFEVEINDFANGWYLHVNDANCKYTIELGRRPNLYQDTIKENYIYITSSNNMSAPNDHILFEKFNPNVQYKNVKTGEITFKNFADLSKLKGMQEIYNIYNLYKKLYKNELLDEITEGNLLNPSSLSSS